MNASANETTNRKQTPATVIAKLRAEAHSSPAFSAVCHVFAMRERARSQVTIHSLKLTMEREGFNFSRAEYERVFKTLSDAGIGKIETDSAGQIRSLKDIRVTLQSIGTVAVGKKERLETFRQRNTFIDLPLVQAKLTQSVTIKKPQGYRVALQAIINGETVDFPLNFTLTGEQICVLIQELQKQKALK